MMARCRRFLRGLSVSVTVLLLVSGLVMVGVGFSWMEGSVPVAELFLHLSTGDGLLVLQVFGPLTVVLSLLGIVAASLDLKPLLLVFSALIFVEFVSLMVVASPLVQVQAQLDGEVDELFLNATPLHRADGDVQREMDKLQTSASCCGLRSFEDWEDQLPVSCLCPAPSSPSSSSDGLCVMKTSSDLHPDLQPSERWIHAKSCGPLLKSYLSFPIKLRIGIISAFATITVFSIVLCLFLGLEDYWRTRPVETTVDDFNRVKYQPKPSTT